MNKKRILILILLVTFLLTGCVKYELDMVMKNDKSISFTIIDSMQKEYAEAAQATPNADKYKGLGYEVEEYNDSKYTGLKLRKKFNNIDEISSEDCKDFELTKLIEIDPSTATIFCSKKIGTMTTYTGNFTYNLSTPEQNQTEDIDIEDYTGEMIFDYTITLPDIAFLVSDNADEKSSNGKTLTWKMKYGELKNINFSFNIDDKDVSEPIIETEEEKETTPEENKKTTSNSSTPQNKKNNPQDINFGSLIGSVAIITLVGTTIFKKLKEKRRSKSPKVNMVHKSPPRNKK